MHEDPEFKHGLFGLKINQGGGGFHPLSERMNFLNCLNNVLPQKFFWAFSPPWALW